ncbi:MAG: hypothetical protein ACRBBN_00790 [Methyloligellaceae bacterium]
MVGTIALALLLSPDLFRDYQMRGETLYNAKKYEFAGAECRKPLQLVVLCQIIVRPKLGSLQSQTFDYLFYGNLGNPKLKILTTTSGQLTINIGRRHLKNRLITFSFASVAMILLLLVSIISMRGSPFGRRQAKTPRYDQDQLQHLASHIVVSDNPVEVWQNILHGTEMSWVVCSRGTLVLCEDEYTPPEQIAWNALDALNFPPPEDIDDEPSVYLNPDYAVWIISYPGNSLLNYVKLSDTLDDETAVRLGQEASKQDAFEKRILYVERRASRNSGGMRY